jgi:lipoprotein-releasing system permease protein
MTPIVTSVVWDVLTAAGGTLALTLIIAMAVGINVLTLLFLGSAVVALERFARIATRVVPTIACILIWSGAMGAALLAWGVPDLVVESTTERVSAWAGLSVGCALIACLTWLAVGRITSGRLAAISVGVLGLGYALLIGGSGQIVYALAPAAIAGIAAVTLLLRRRRRNGDSPVGDSERMLRILTLSLGVGVLVALGVPEPTVELTSIGGSLLAFCAMLAVFGLVPVAAAGFVATRDSFEWFIAVRYLIAKRRQTFISVITGICVVGIAAGVWLIIVVLSVMNGFERTWRDEIIGNRAHFTVQSGLGPFADYDQVVDVVSGVPGVLAASPYLDAEGMVRGNMGEIVGVRVRGVDPDLVGNVTDLRQDLIEGSLDDLGRPLAEGDDPAIVIGSQLAGSLGISVGDPLLLISPFGGPRTPLGPAPRLARFVVAGVFESSFFQYDEMFTYVSLPAAQDFRRVEDVVDGVEVRTTDFYRSQQAAGAARAALGFPYYTRDWKEFFPAFFQALKSERIMMFVLLTMIMVVAAFAIVSTLIMMIMEKSGDIAILKTMGAEDDAIERIFAIEGALIGLVGTSLGVIAGISVTAQIDWIQRQIEDLTGIDTLPASVYQFSTLPAQLDAGQIAIAVGIAMVLALGATLLPSRQASRLDPVEALRYE